MNNANYNFSLDINEHGSPIVLKAKKDDTGKKINLTLRTGSKPYEISKSCYAVYTSSKPDGSVLYNSCTIEDNVITYEFTDQTCSAVGRCISEIRLYGTNNKLITSANFVLLVEGSVYNDDLVSSSSEFTMLNELVLEATDFLKEGTFAVVSEDEPTAENTSIWIDSDSDEEYSIPEIKDDSVSPVDTWSSRRIVEFADEMFAGPTEEIVGRWLDKHPEATTSVQDGSIDEVKLTNSARIKKASFYNTVADMIADKKLIAGMTAATLGYYNKNDGGGAIYAIEARTDSDVPDGFYHFTANGTAKIITDGKTVNFLQLGGKANDEAFDNATVFYKILTNANGYSFTTIALPRGVFYTKNAIELDSQIGITIAGAGGSDSTVGTYIIGQSSDCCVITSCTGITIKDVIISSAVGYKCINFPAKSGRSGKTLFADCTFKGHDGINMDCPSGYNRIERCYFSNSGTYGINIGENYSAGDGEVGLNYIYIKNNAFGAADHAIKIYQGEYIFIEGNDFVTKNGIMATKKDGLATDHINIIGNVFYNTTVGIDVTNQVRHIISEKNTFRLDTNGVAEKYYGNDLSTGPINLSIENNYLLKGSEHTEKFVVLKNVSYANFKSPIPANFGDFNILSAVEFAGQFITIHNDPLPRISLQLVAGEGTKYEFDYSRYYRRPDAFIVNNKNVNVTYSFNGATYIVKFELVNTTQETQQVLITFVG